MTIRDAFAVIGVVTFFMWWADFAFGAYLAISDRPMPSNFQNTTSAFAYGLFK